MSFDLAGTFSVGVGVELGNNKNLLLDRRFLTIIDWELSLYSNTMSIADIVYSKVNFVKLSMNITNGKHYLPVPHAKLFSFSLFSYWLNLCAASPADQ